MKFKKILKLDISIEDLLVFLYLITLPFLKIGFKVYYYTLSLSDFILSIFFIKMIYDLFLKKIKIPKQLLTFLYIYLIFLFLIGISFFQAKNKLDFLLDFLPYIYGLFLIFSFIIYFSKNPNNEKIFNSSIVFSIILISLLAILYLIMPEERFTFVSPSKKYIFFLKKPNQLSMLSIIYFCFYLILNINLINLNFIWIILPGLYLNIILSTASRSGLFLSGVSIIIFYYIFFKKIYKDKKNIKLTYKLVISLIFLILIFTLHKNVFFTYGSRRALRVFDNIKEFDLSDDIRREINKKAISVFKNNVLFGIGLGNFKKNYFHHEIHNAYLSLLTETGVIGFTAFIILLFIIIKNVASNFLLEFWGIIGIILLFNWFHYVLRERWVWLFFVFFQFYNLKLKNNFFGYNKKE